MGKTKKVVVWCLAITLALVVAVGVAVKVYVTKERVLAWVVPPLEEELGRKVAIGDVSVGFTSFDLIDFSISGTQSDKPLASVGRVRVAWRLLPLLSARLEVAEVTVASPAFHIVRLADGTLAIDDLISSDDKGGEKRAGKPASGPREGGRAEVKVEMVAITDGSFTFEDRMESPAKSYSVDGFDAEIKGLSSGSRATFELAANLGLLGGAPVAAVGSLSPQTELVEVNVTVGSFELVALNSYMGDGPSFASGSALVTAGVSVKGGEPGPIELDLQVKQMVLEKGMQRGKSADISLSTEVAVGAELVKINGFSLDAAGQVIEANGQVALTEVPVITLSAKSKSLLVDRLTALLPPESGQGGDKAGGSKAGAKGAGDQTPAKVGIEADIYLNVDHLEAAGLAFDGVVLEIELKDGVLKVKPLKADFYQGTIGLNSTVELEREGPPLRADARVDGVRVEDLLPALSPALKDTLTGELAANLNAKSSGAGLGSVIAALDGTVKDGKLANSPLVEKLGLLLGSEGMREINFYTLLWDVKVKKGVATVERLYLDGREVALRGDGTVELEDQRLNMGVVASVPVKMARKLINDKNIIEALTDEQGRVGLPLRLTGVATDPKYSLDERKLSKVAGKAAKKAVTKEVQKILEKKGGKLAPVEKVLPGLMDKLFGK